MTLMEHPPLPFSFIRVIKSALALATVPEVRAEAERVEREFSDSNKMTKLQAIFNLADFAQKHNDFHLAQYLAERYNNGVSE